MTTVLQLFFKRAFVRTATRWLTTILVVAAIATAAYVAYQRFSIPRVIVTDVVQGPVVQAFYATGTLLPDREYPVRANVEGTLVEVLVDKGSQVQKGQKLARVYVEEYMLKRTQAEAELELKQQLADPQTSPALLEFDAKIRVAQKQMDTAQREYNRLSQLRTSGGRTLTELEAAEESAKTAMNTIDALKSAKAAKLLEMQRDVKTAKAALDIAEWNIDQQTITSPVDGVVLDWPTSTGTRVRVNDTIMTVADIRYDQLVMRTNVDEEDKTRVHLDQIVHITLYSYPGRVFEGRVKKIYPKADPARRTFEVDVRILEADLDFSAGMTGELAFVVDRKDNALVVPTQAVQAGDVWILRDGKLAKAEVELGLRSIQRTEVLSGLQAGDQVVVSPIGNLQPGLVVRATHMDADAAAGLNEPKAQAASSFKGFK
jgi:multidrug efflux pump subunit AcrA (membrane-fusion protein)